MSDGVSGGEVVIGEGVALDLRPARVPSRVIALAIDLVALGAVGLLLLLAVALAGDTFDAALGSAVGLALGVGLVVGWPTLWETLTRGRSPGKYAMGLRVVRDDGGPIGFRQALTRALAFAIVDVGVLSAGTGAIGLVVSAASPRGKRVGDLLAGTLVLRERPPSAASGSGALPVVHPRLAEWATGLQLATLPEPLAASARSFLLRAPVMAPDVRRSLAERLAADVADRVAPPAPAGVPAEDYLAAVLGECRRRESAVRTPSPEVPPVPAAPPPAPAPARAGGDGFAPPV